MNLGTVFHFPQDCDIQTLPEFLVCRFARPHHYVSQFITKNRKVCMRVYVCACVCVCIVLVSLCRDLTDTHKPKSATFVAVPSLSRGRDLLLLSFLWHRRQHKPSLNWFHEHLGEPKPSGTFKQQTLAVFQKYFFKVITLWEMFTKLYEIS